MNDNPYESPSGVASTGRFRPWRVAVVVGLFLALVVGAIAWQAFREHHARNRAMQNLDQLRQALEQYQERISQPPLGDPPESE